MFADKKDFEVLVKKDVTLIRVFHMRDALNIFLRALEDIENPFHVDIVTHFQLKDLLKEVNAYIERAQET